MFYPYLCVMKRPEMPEDGVNRVTLEIEENYTSCERLDVLVTRRLPKISRSRVKKLIDEGRITINGATAKASTIVPGGVFVDVVFPHPPRPPATAEDIPLDVIFEDDAILIINKPAGMVVHPAAGHHSGTLVNALLGRYENLPNPGGPTMRPGIVHRLDKDTSGVMVVAKSEYAMTQLGRLFHDHDLDREYQAIVWGDPDEKGTIDAPLARHPGDRKRYAIVEDGKRAITNWRVLERFGFASLVALRLETGRTHQIRVHMASRGWPVFADATYGGKMHGLARLTSHQRAMGRQALNMMPRQALHAKTLGFRHPITDEIVRFDSNLPNDMQKVLDFLRSQMDY